MDFLQNYQNKNYSKKDIKTSNEIIYKFTIGTFSTEILSFD